MIHRISWKTAVSRSHWIFNNDSVQFIHSFHFQECYDGFEWIWSSFNNFGLWSEEFYGKLYLKNYLLEEYPINPQILAFKYCLHILNNISSGACWMDILNQLQRCSTFAKSKYFHKINKTQNLNTENHNNVVRSA